MKWRVFHFYVLFLAFILSSVGAYFYAQSQEALNKVLVFVTVGIDYEQHPNEVSSYELQRAGEHFSDLLLGWTLDPHFKTTFAESAGATYTFTGQRQEKQNLLFAITDPISNLTEEDLGVGYQLLELLNQELELYNAATHQGYVLAIQNVSYEEGRDSPFPGIGFVLFSMTVVGFFLLTYEYAQTRRRPASAS